MSQLVNVAATKQGLVYEDHHYKIDGRYERSPPSKLKGMYDYLPTEMVCRTPRAQTLSRVLVMCAKHRVHLHRLQRRPSLFPRSFPCRVTTRDRRWRRSSARWLASVCMPRYATATPTASRCGSTSMPTFASRAPRCAPPSSLPSPPSPGALPDCISLIASPSPGALAPHSSSLLEPPYLVHISCISRAYLVHISSISRPYLVHVSLGRSTASTAGWSPSTPRGTTTSRINACKSLAWPRPGRARMRALVCTPAYGPRKTPVLDPASPHLPSPPATPPCQPRFMWLLSIACSPEEACKCSRRRPTPSRSPQGKFGRGSSGTVSTRFDAARHIMAGGMTRKARAPTRNHPSRPCARPRPSPTRKGSPSRRSFEMVRLA